MFVIVSVYRGSSTYVCLDFAICHPVSNYSRAKIMFKLGNPPTTDKAPPTSRSCSCMKVSITPPLLRWFESEASHPLSDAFMKCAPLTANVSSASTGCYQHSKINQKALHKKLFLTYLCLIFPASKKKSNQNFLNNFFLNPSLLSLSVFSPSATVF